MDEKSFRVTQWLRVGILIFGIHTIFFLLQVPQVYFYNAGSAQAPPLWFALARLAIATYFWMLLTPLVLWLGARLPIVRRRLARNSALHFLFSLVFGAAQAVGYQAGVALISGMPVSRALEILSNPGGFLNFVTNAVFHYVTVLAIQQAYLYFRQAQDREFRLQQAELQSLKTQLHPHFLFNTLNAIAALIHRDPKTADDTLTQLSDLLRLSLRSGKAHEVSLKDELDFLRAYLRIHQTLMKNRLTVRWAISSDTLDARVPNMILQPLVENSIRHGISPREAGGSLEVKSLRRDGFLLLEVSDDGLGLDGEKGSARGNNGGGGGIGLTNTRARLRHLYGETHEFSLGTAGATAGGGGRGAVARIAIPFREQGGEKGEFTK